MEQKNSRPKKASKRNYAATDATRINITALKKRVAMLEKKMTFILFGLRVSATMAEDLK